MPLSYNPIHPSNALRAITVTYPTYRAINSIHCIGSAAFYLLKAIVVSRNHLTSAFQVSKLCWTCLCHSAVT